MPTELLTREAGRAMAADWLVKDAKAKVALLGERQRECLIYISKGLTLQETADAMGIGFQTVMTTRKIVYQKLGVERACEAAVMAAKAGIV